MHIIYHQCTTGYTGHQKCIDKLLVYILLLPQKSKVKHFLAFEFIYHKTQSSMVNHISILHLTILGYRKFQAHS